ncbi:hypothetical protein EK21DRAFT_56144 [Setomelanomma holmii]|uniref:Uncharacterized protein n=1 Tax=Setomelanomma holmii TaxID=210430 RepID=A0A9P4HGH8_9PLEO|nr:hypothetical protein EK21DRAFT_56144 [Setomelanomma holmii]
MDRTAGQPHFLDLFAKEWPKHYSGSHKPRDNRPCLEDIFEGVRAQGQEPNGDDAQLFMESYDDDLMSSTCQDAIRFLLTVSSDNLYDQKHSKKNGTAWIHDCTLDQTLQKEHPATLLGDVALRVPRDYDAPLTAGDLHRHLRERRFDHDTYLDADRRLIRILDPDGFDFLAVVKTATFHQRRSIQDVICKYIAQETSIKATIPEEGYANYQLELHIPFYALRRSHPEQDFVNRQKRTHRGWMNLSFLDTEEIDPEDEGVLGIHQAQISITICGTDNSRWIAYCFEDRYFDEDAELGQDEHTLIHQSDQIANGEFGAENIIWDSREYYLRVFLIRMRQVQREWIRLVDVIESGIKKHSWGRVFYSATRTGVPPEMDESVALMWINSTLELLRKLLDDIQKTNDAWTSFISNSGDFAYFSDTHTNPRMKRTFNQLTNVFNEMQKLQKTLRRIAGQCRERAESVNLRLASESKKNAELTVYFISPFALVSTFFAIPVPILGFDRNFLSFVIAILVYIVALQGLLFFWGGRLWRQAWWERLSRRAKAAWNGDSSLTTTNDAGVTKLRRRATHAGFV